jgi:REP element-mobilizing transposase RayT
MGQPFPGQGYGQCYSVTTTYANWRRFGDIPGFYEGLAEALRFYLLRYDVRLAGYTFMPDYLHLLPFIEGSQLGNFMRDFKRYVAQKVALDVGIHDRQVWTAGYTRTAIATRAALRAKLDSIHRSPVTVGLVERPEDWRWSSAGDYLHGIPGRLPVWKDWEQEAGGSR